MLRALMVSFAVATLCSSLGRAQDLPSPPLKDTARAAAQAMPKISKALEATAPGSALVDEQYKLFFESTVRSATSAASRVAGAAARIADKPTVLQVHALMEGSTLLELNLQTLFVLLLATDPSQRPARVDEMITQILDASSAVSEVNFDLLFAGADFLKAADLQLADCPTAKPKS